MEVVDRMGEHRDHQDLEDLVDLVDLVVVVVDLEEDLVVFVAAEVGTEA